MRVSLFSLLGCCISSLGMLQNAHGDGRDNYAQERERMVREQLCAPRYGTHAIHDKRVIAAMSRVKRHALVPREVRDLAYADSPLPIGHDQTISQPYIVAFMTQALSLKADDKVLEIGSGSGYQAAVLAEIVAQVYTIEIVKPLADRAKRDLKRLGYKNIFVKAGDGYAGWPQVAPFDAIIVTCAPESIPAPLSEQLREGGRMIIPVGPEGGIQELILLTKQDGQIKRDSVLPVRFVPMTGQSRANAPD